MEKKQTAVEWIEQELEFIVSTEYINQIIQKAKEMEKEQIIDAYYQCGRDNFEHIKVINKSATDYYNITYGKETDNTGMDIR